MCLVMVVAALTHTALSQGLSQFAETRGMDAEEFSFHDSVH